MKLTELPRQCPDCQQPFTPLVKHERSLSWLARLILGVGVISTLVVGMIVYLLVFLAISATPIGFPIRGRLAVLISLAMIAVVLTPGLLIGHWALTLPKCVRLLCFRCGWKQTFLVDNHG